MSDRKTWQERAEDMLARWEERAVPLDREVRAAYVLAEASGDYFEADELSQDRDDVFAQFAEEAVRLIRSALGKPEPVVESD
jgi:hypothetical protein